MSLGVRCVRRARESPSGAAARSTWYPACGGNCATTLNRSPRTTVCRHSTGRPPPQPSRSIANAVTPASISVDSSSPSRAATRTAAVQVRDGIHARPPPRVAAPIASSPHMPAASRASWPTGASAPVALRQRRYVAGQFRLPHSRDPGALLRGGQRGQCLVHRPGERRVGQPTPEVVRIGGRQRLLLQQPGGGGQAGGEVRDRHAQRGHPPASTGRNAGTYAPITAA